MNIEDAKKLPKYRKNPIFDGMPEYLKDPANYEKIQKALLDIMAGSCSHGEVLDWANCKKCQRRFTERGHFLEKLGFKSGRQYLVWQKVMYHMITGERVPIR